jgi:hypothetical protein
MLIVSDRRKSSLEPHLVSPASTQHHPPEIGRKSRPPAIHIRVGSSGFSPPPTRTPSLSISLFDSPSLISSPNSRSLKVSHSLFFLDERNKMKRMRKERRRGIGKRKGEDVHHSLCQTPRNLTMDRSSKLDGGWRPKMDELVVKIVAATESKVSSFDFAKCRRWTR